MEGLSVSAVEKSRLLDSRYAFRTFRISDDERGNTGGVSGRNSERRAWTFCSSGRMLPYVFSGLHSPSSCGPRLQNTVCLVMLWREYGLFCDFVGRLPEVLRGSSCFCAYACRRASAVRTWVVESSGKGLCARSERISVHVVKARRKVTGCRGCRIGVLWCGTV